MATYQNNNYSGRDSRRGSNSSGSRRRSGTSGRSSYPARRSEPSPREKKRAALIREKRRVRKDIAVTAILLSAVFAFMTIYMVVYSASQEQTLFENDYNGREEALLSKNLRGKIYADDGSTVLADSVESSDGTESREYPYGNLFSHIVGYDAEGGAGIELQHNYDLVHSDLSLAEKADCDAAGQKYPGNEVYTTLDVGLQQAASDALGNNKGAVIVTEVNTGKILAMVSKPDFDPSTVEANWDSLLADSDSGTLVNRATQGLYAPGSTFKIFDAIEFMQEDMNKAENFTFDCPGYVTIDGETITCYHWEVHGHLDFIGAFAHSCNSAFATIGTSLNRESFNATLNRLLFNQTLPYDMPSGVSSYTLDDNTSTKEVMQLSIGQGQTLMTPLHLNMITAAVANGGTIYKPYVVSSVRTAQTSRNPQGKVLSQTDEATVAVDNAIGETICSKLREMMRGVVEFGTATKLLDRSYNAAGKTGSAEFISGTSESHAWFTGFAPYDDPKVAITVIVEGAGSGGSAAVPVAKEVLDQYFAYDGSTEMQTPTLYTSTTSSQSTPGDSETPENVMSLNLDTNNDGVMDAIDVDGDGVADAFDTDGDGIADTMAVNGQPVDNGASAEATPTPTPQTAENTDSDGDGIMDADEDENGNGIPDIQELQDGTLNADGTSNADGNAAAADQSQQAQGTGGQQAADQTQQAADAAGADAGQAQATDTTGTQTAGDQTQTITDANGNGIDDSQEAAQATPVDANGDGLDDNTGQAIAQ